MNENTFLQKLGRNVAFERRKKGLSQDDLYLEAEIGRRTLNRIESGETNPTAAVLFKIAKALGVNVSTLFSDL